MSVQEEACVGDAVGLHDDDDDEDDGVDYGKLLFPQAVVHRQGGQSGAEKVRGHFSSLGVCFFGHPQCIKVLGV